MYTYVSLYVRLRVYCTRTHTHASSLGDFAARTCLSWLSIHPITCIFTPLVNHLPHVRKETVYREYYVGRLCARSWSSGNLGKIALRLTEIIRMYFDA